MKFLNKIRPYLHIITGVACALAASIVLLSLGIQLLNFGMYASSRQNIFSSFGSMLSSVYGISSILIPVFLVAAAICCYLKIGGTKIAFIFVAMTVPFFTIAITENICRTLLSSTDKSFIAFKMTSAIIISGLLVATEIVGIMILSDKASQIISNFLSKKSAGDETVAPISNVAEPNVEDKIENARTDDNFGIPKSVFDFANYKVGEEVEVAPKKTEPYAMSEKLKELLQKTNEASERIMQQKKVQKFPEINLFNFITPAASKNAASVWQEAIQTDAYFPSQKKEKIALENNSDTFLTEEFTSAKDTSETIYKDASKKIENAPTAVEDVAVAIEDIPEKIEDSREDFLTEREFSSETHTPQIIHEDVQTKIKDVAVEVEDALINAGQSPQEARDKVAAIKDMTTEIKEYSPVTKTQNISPEPNNSEKSEIEENSLVGAKDVFAQMDEDIRNEIYAGTIKFPYAEAEHKVATAIENCEEDEKLDDEDNVIEEIIIDESLAENDLLDEDEFAESEDELIASELIEDELAENDSLDEDDFAESEDELIASESIEDELAENNSLDEDEFSENEDELTASESIEDEIAENNLLDEDEFVASESIEDELAENDSLDEDGFAENEDELTASELIEDELAENDSLDEDSFAENEDELTASESIENKLPDENAFAEATPQIEDVEETITIAKLPAVPPKPKFKGKYKIDTELLTEYEDDKYWIIDKETEKASLKLKETLNEFHIEADVIGIKKGPVVTMFELLPAPGVKLSKVVALQDNIALRLAASSVRIVAPIPGRQAVGIEIPNKNRSIVSFREIVEMSLPEFNKMSVPVILGKDILGKPQIIDLVKTPHLLIAGATGAGKSVCVNSMILSILYKRSPNDVKLIMIDPKIVELKLYNDIPHLLTPVITEPKRAFQSLQYCLCEMERRYALLDAMGVRDISNYNKRIVERKMATEKLPFIIVVIDEFADLMATTGKELETTLARLAAMSRAVGIHLVLATQRPSIDVITGLIKANIPSRIAFMVASKMDSRIIIDQVGAEKLLGRGDMLYASATDPFPTRIQGTFVTDNEVESVVEAVKQYGEPDYIDDEIFVDDEDDSSGDSSLFSDGEDPLYSQALDIVIQSGKASASYLQRRLKIGYNRAARLVEEMEERGVVGPANGSKPREVIHVP